MVAGGHGKGTGSVGVVVFVTSKTKYKNYLTVASLSVEASLACKML